MPTPARPRARRHRRFTLPAALTCVTVLAGGALAGPASAAGAEGGPQGTVTLPEPSAGERPAFSVPDRGSAKARGAVPSRAGAARAAVNRADFNGDGFGELVYRTNYGSVWVDWSTGGAEVISEDDSEVKDLLLPGDLTGDGTPDLLTLSPTGALRLHSGRTPPPTAG
ncbi:FG-GAP repeat domain-containing protein [Streptomyces sp. NPDC096310]|uniref:FG-GAP repeat domain-containing protein n=1 Tax=Streptomyces sp. NPDC096310 TaxID=3366082 RepID=UPI00380129D3